ncbi:ribonuclease E inhibitor RraB [Shewanella schlegeliana]|uniref:Regulator of ribonuclease activity B n=1 Tax=Shewanella schlegeliana TaxID=190308 RepID=A0ABS1SWP3_9GAMM|nr:ribonuclease E inhibitor RraB [Shewanella schlegeliana]MBL4912961.1 ribonuclease E inhibitor RraB [Shewanella schlegeliana]MCL1108943.1 ribonuclease E inhibitor RraB [Shewanella schlegeliana]GIU23597.1 regulator of ribonuclease activity B [Shewanella schlegeliana]
MSIERQLNEQKQENREIVEAILADGSLPDAEYTIEHHFSSTNFDRLEKAAVDAFKLGYEVNDAEEMELEDGSVIYCFDAVANHELNTDLLDSACEKMIELAAKQKIDYDGWGTYFIDENGEEVRDEDDYEDEELH